MTSAFVQRGDVVLTTFPFTDLTGAAVRPAVVISPGLIGDDLIVAGISSVVRGSKVATDCSLEMTHPEFPLTGLRVASVIRAHKLAALERKVLIKRLGRLGPQLQAELDRALRIVVGV